MNTYQVKFLVITQDTDMSDGKVQFVSIEVCTTLNEHSLYNFLHSIMNDIILEEYDDFLEDINSTVFENLENQDIYSFEIDGIHSVNDDYYDEEPFNYEFDDRIVNEKGTKMLTDGKEYDKQYFPMSVINFIKG